jgi:KEOPS complex subunit Cgi121
MRVVEGEATVGDVDTFVARLAGIGEEYGATVQAFDARYVVDRTHLERAVELADRAAERGEPIARDRAVEILLYAAGRRQIDRALEMGVSAGECPVVAVVDGGDEAGAADALRELLDPAGTLGAYDPDRVRAFFDVSKAEVAATSGVIADLVRERVALLPVEK